MRWLELAVLAGAIVTVPSPPQGVPAPPDQARPPAAHPVRTAADLARLKAAYEADRSNVRAGLDYAVAVIHAGQPELARPVLYALLAQPASLTPALAAEAWFQMGHVHLRAQEYDEAIACWTTVLHDHPESVRASGAAINVASVRFQVLGQADKAFDVLTAAFKAHAIRGSHLELANLLLFQIYVDRRQYTEARGLLGTLPATGPRHELIKNAVPVVYWKTGDQDRARGLLDALFEAAKDDASALNNLAGLLAEHKVALDFAIACSARAIVASNGARHDIWDTYADALFQAGQTAKAVEAEEKAVALADAQRDQAAYRTHLERYKAALKKSGRPPAGRPSGIRP
jgi:tetratricopeptide (TPR) repeat protein